MATKNRVILASIGLGHARKSTSVLTVENSENAENRHPMDRHGVQQKDPMKRRTLQSVNVVTKPCLPAVSKPTAARVPLAQVTSNNANVRIPPAFPRKKKIGTRVSADVEQAKLSTKTVLTKHQQQPGFKIHLDDEENVLKSSDQALQQPQAQDTLKEAAKANNAQVPPLSTHNLGQDNLKESPMVLDVSTTSDSDQRLNNTDSDLKETEEDKENEIPSSKNTSLDIVQGESPVVVEDSITSLYSADIYAYLRRLELVYRPKAKYMLKQPDITHGMRSILVDWLVEVNEEYGLQPETLFLAVSYIDRFLSCMSVLRTKLQLVGTASMLVAAKFEEIYPPEIDEFVYITDDTYTKQQVLRMEQVILRVLSFGLATPTIHYFVTRFCVMGQLTEFCRNLAMYLSELSLLEADPFLQFLPSVVAGSAVCLACYTLDLDPWNEHLVAQSGYAIADFKDCITLLHKSYVNAPHSQQQSIREKYKGAKYSEVANMVPPPVTLCI